MKSGTTPVHICCDSCLSHTLQELDAHWIQIDAISDVNRGRTLQFHKWFLRTGSTVELLITAGNDFVDSDGDVLLEYPTAVDDYISAWCRLFASSGKYGGVVIWGDSEYYRQGFLPTSSQAMSRFDSYLARLGP